MKEYKGFKYFENSVGGWTVVFPTGTKLQAPSSFEEDLLKSIDELIESTL